MRFLDQTYIYSLFVIKFISSSLQNDLPDFANKAHSYHTHKIYSSNSFVGIKWRTCVELIQKLITGHSKGVWNMSVGRRLLNRRRVKLWESGWLRETHKLLHSEMILHTMYNHVLLNPPLVFHWIVFLTCGLNTHVLPELPWCPSRQAINTLQSAARYCADIPLFIQRKKTK